MVSPQFVDYWAALSQLKTFYSFFSTFNPAICSGSRTLPFLTQVTNDDHIQYMYVVQCVPLTSQETAMWPLRIDTVQTAYTIYIRHTRLETPSSRDDSTQHLLRTFHPELLVQTECFCVQTLSFCSESSELWQNDEHLTMQDVYQG